MSKVTQPTSEAFKDAIAVKDLPSRFLYRGTVYKRDELTKEVVDRMAKDKKFHAIVVKQEPKASTPAKADDGGKDKK